MESWLIATVIGLVIALVNVIGGGLVIRWLVRQVHALKGTVAAQTETLKTIGEVNRTVLEVFKAMEPRRWAEEVQVHKKLADEKAAAVVDGARRQFEKDKEALQEEALKGYQEAVGVGLSLLPYVPNEARQKVIYDTGAPDFIKNVFLDVAATAPDWSRRLQTIERLAALGTLAAGLAHEIKNPLTSLLIYSQQLSRRFGEERFRQNFETVVPRELERINRIVEGLLRLARPTGLSLGPVHLPDLLERALALYANQLEAKQITVVREYAGALPPIQADPEHLYRALTNLVANALEAMSQGGRLTLRLGWSDGEAALLSARRARAGRRVKIEIADTGVGIPASDADRVFNPFYTTKEHGTGLGLSLTHKIVEDHGGTIDFSSTPSAGTTFRIVLPLGNDQQPTS